MEPSGRRAQPGRSTSPNKETLQPTPRFARRPNQSPGAAPCWPHLTLRGVLEPRLPGLVRQGLRALFAGHVVRRRRPGLTPKPDHTALGGLPPETRDAGSREATLLDPREAWVWAGPGPGCPGSGTRASTVSRGGDEASRGKVPKPTNASSAMEPLREPLPKEPTGVMEQQWQWGRAGGGGGGWPEGSPKAAAYANPVWTALFDYR